MPTPLQEFARQTPPYTVPDDTYRAALQNDEDITEAKLREWGMPEERIQELLNGGDEVRGCTNPNASNFNPEATVDDGSRETLPVSGCMDPEAPNYNPAATVDDGSCSCLLYTSPSPRDS